MEQEILRYYDLRKEIEKYDDYYYNKNKSLISDFEYDQLRKELETLEAKYPHLGEYARNNVGAKLTLNRFPKVKHKYKMTSLKNSYNKQELKDWMIKTNELIEQSDIRPKELFHAEWKFDGLSLSLKYNKEGLLIQALTRGDGEYGEDVTENAYMIKSIPKQIKITEDNLLYPNLCAALEKDGWIEVRGEILMSFEEFDRINATREAQGEELYANPRNLASGTLRNLDKSIFEERELLFAPYHLENVEYSLPYYEFLVEFRKMGFEPIANLVIALTSIDEIESWIDSILSIFDMNKIKDRVKYNDITIPIDGIVFKIDKVLYDKFGLISDRYPKGGIAYKFEPENYHTKLLDITYQIGRTGKITPVAELVPVLIDGSTISRCTLHNFDEIERLSLRKNCTVNIIKSAAVIPKIIGRSDNVAFDESIIEVPKVCPVCGTSLVKNTCLDGNLSVDTYCPNDECPEVIKQQILYHFSILKVKGFGPALYDAFAIAYTKHTNETIKSLLQIYTIAFSFENILQTVRELAGSKVVQNFIDSLKHELEHPIFHRQLASLGLEGIGIQTAKEIEKKCKNYDDFLNHYKEYNLPENVIRYIVVFKDIPNSLVNNVKLLIEYLSHANYKFLDNSNGSQPKDYVCSVVITGTFDFGSRDQIAKFLDENDIKVQSSVTKTTDVLIAGDNAGSKLDKAKELNIITIYPKSYSDLINQLQAAQK